MNRKISAEAIFDDERLDVFVLRTSTTQGCMFSELLVNNVLEVLVMIIHHGKHGFASKNQNTAGWEDGLMSKVLSVQA